VGVGIFSDASAGMAIGPIDTALGLHALGAEVTIFAEPAATLPARALHLTDKVVRLPAAAELPPLVRDALFLPAKLALGRRWARALEEHPVDVVHAFSPGTAAPLPKSLPVVVQAWYQPARATMRRRLRRESAYGTGGVGASLPRPIGPAVNGAAHLARQAQTHASDLLGYRRASLLLTSTPSAASFLARQGHRAECIPPCIATAIGDPAPRDPGDAFRIAFCAHPLDRPWKGLRFLLEGLAGSPPSAPALELTLIGGWAQRPDALLEAVRETGVAVEELGRLSRDAYLERLAARTDVLAAPALWEEWGYSLFEALSRGVPVIAFDLYPYSETIDADLGALVPARDPAALARAIAAASAGALPPRETVLATARRRFGAEAVAERLLGAYERARAARTSPA
jgi:glycosyltransferase involved in cell wall biosynthesis